MHASFGRATASRAVDSGGGAPVISREAQVLLYGYNTRGRESGKHASFGRATASRAVGSGGGAPVIPRGAHVWL